GRPALPPAWSFGLWLSTSFTTNYDEATTSSFVQGMFERDIPLSVFHFDCFWMKEFHWCDFEWDERVFPDVKGMLQRYKEKGLKIDVWINPYIAQGTDFFKEGAENGYLLMRADGRGVKQIDTWQAGMGLVDFTNPAAVKWYTDKLKTLLDAGVDCFKTDFGERIPVDVAYYDGSDPVTMHNYYTYLYNQAVFDLLKREKGEGEAVLFARSATAGCQQFPVHWGGDCSASYPSMAETLRGGLSFAMSGFSFWSHDISGFEQTAPPDLYKRWVAFGLLSTHSRLHGSTSYRVPWLFDEESSDVVRFFTKLKCRLMPYIFSKAVEAHEKGTPVMRPMIFEYMSDPAANYTDMQYMLGESLLVAPIFNDKGTADYYLPAGRWTHLLTGEKRDGGRYYHDSYDYFSLPLYVRENTILAMGAVDTRPDYAYENGVTLHIYELGDGERGCCDIVSMEGTHVMQAEAVRVDDTITLKLTASPENMKVCIHADKTEKKEIPVNSMETIIRL
ncbi:MAG TPA: alpha-xylosidase, partial [Lachnospiraceae bacterium]|nr:alpha-xylosidase [Lachnospiraceae bacterium]